MSTPRLWASTRALAIVVYKTVSLHQNRGAVCFAVEQGAFWQQCARFNGNGTSLALYQHAESFLQLIAGDLPGDDRERGAASQRIAGWFFKNGIADEFNESRAVLEGDIAFQPKQLGAKFLDRFEEERPVYRFFRLKRCRNNTRRRFMHAAMKSPTVQEPF